MAWAGTTKRVDNFDYPLALATTSTGWGGWTIKDTSSAGTPTYTATAEDGGSVKLTCDNTNEAQVVTLYHSDLLMYDVRKLSNVWWVAKVSGIDAVTVLTLGVGSAQADDEDTMATCAWFKIEGATSTSAVVVETDDATTDNADVATGTTLSTTYKKMLVDFTQGLADVRFYVDGARVAATTTFDMSALAAGLNVQPFVQVSKASGTGVPSVQIAQFGITYNWSYGA